jgi:hypothetical protein
MIFISRITKTNNFIQNIKNGEDTAIFESIINNKMQKFKIIKYTNIEKPKTEETKEELNKKIDDNAIIINENNNNKIKLKQTINKYKTDNKKCATQIKNKLISKQERIKLNKQIILNRINKKQDTDKLKIINDNITKLEQERNVLKKIHKQLVDYEHSDYYILTNNFDLSNSELKKIYKKRWVIETAYRFDKSKLNLNQMNNKNNTMIKHNIFAIQFIQIFNAFIHQLLKLYVKKEHQLNNNHIYDCIHSHILTLFHKLLKFKKIKTDTEKNKLNNKHTKTNNNIVKTHEPKINIKYLKKEYMLKLISVFISMLKNQVKYKEITKATLRIKKRQSNNKFNYRSGIE